MTTHHEIHLLADDVDQLLDDIGYSVTAHVDDEKRTLRYDNGGYRITVSVEAIRQHATPVSLHKLIANVYLHEPQHAPRYAETDLRLNWTSELVLAHAIAGLLSTADSLAGIETAS